MTRLIYIGFDCMQLFTSCECTDIVCNKLQAVSVHIILYVATCELCVYRHCIQLLRAVNIHIVCNYLEAVNAHNYIVCNYLQAVNVHILYIYVTTCKL